MSRDSPSVPRRRPRTVPLGRAGRAAPRPPRTSSARPATSSRRSPSSRRATPTWCRSTSTSRAAAVTRGGFRPRRAPGDPFLALSASDVPDDVLATIRAGARGYVTKSISARGSRHGDPSRGRRRRDLLTLARRLRARRLQRQHRRRDSHAYRPRTRPAHRSASKKSYCSSPVATPTRSSPLGCTCPSRRSRPTSRASCASSNSPTVTRSPAGPPTARCCDGVGYVGAGRRVPMRSSKLAWKKRSRAASSMPWASSERSKRASGFRPPSMCG